jgi:SAM-dependent methyltransferase
MNPFVEVTVVNPNLTPTGSEEPPAHPLAIELGLALAGRDPAPRVLLLGIGSGRNVAPLVAAGASVDIVEADAERARVAAIRFAAGPRVRVTRGTYAGPYAFSGGFAGALSTHALLHGDIASIERAVAAIANRLAPGGALYATFGSTNDPRYAAGSPIEPFVTAPRDGSEVGVPHAYFDERRLRAVLEGFTIDTIVETSAAETAGRWAHDANESRTMLHWFVRARKAPAGR